MHKPMQTLSLLAFALATSSCATTGPVATQVVCPRLLAPPPTLMQPSNAGKKVRAELLAPPSSATPKSQGSSR